MIPIAKPIIEEEEKLAVQAVLESGMLSQGEKVEELEQQFIRLTGAKHAVAFCNGTQALHAAVHCLGIREGDEVITPPFTFISSANCILMEKAKVVFADVKAETFNIDPEEAEKAVTPKTRCIIAVDLYGQPYDYAAIREIAKKNRLLIIEDAAQAIGGYIDDVDENRKMMCGTLGDCSVFSMYATKNVMAGEGGMVTTDDARLAEQLKRVRHHGQDEKTRYEYYELGYNYRMTNVLAAIGVEQMKKLERFTKARRKNAAILTEGLAGIKGIRIPHQRESTFHVYHQYPIIVKGHRLSRDELKEELEKRGIETAIFYPKPLHMHPAFLRMGFQEGQFPVSEEISKSILCLPVHPLVSGKDIRHIVEAVRELSGHAMRTGR